MCAPRTGWGTMNTVCPLVSVLLGLRRSPDLLARPDGAGAAALARGSARHDPDFIVDNFSATRMNPDGSERHSLAKGIEMMHYPDDNSTHIEAPRFTH